MTGPGKGCSPEVVGSPGCILQGAGGPTGGVGASQTTPPPAMLDAAEVGRGLQAPAKRWPPLSTRSRQGALI